MTKRLKLVIVLLVDNKNKKNMETLFKNPTPLDTEPSLEADKSPEKGELFKVEYKGSIERFALLRAKEDYPELSGTEAERAGLASMEANYALLEAVGGAELREDSIESICTVTIPVAILNEDINSVISAVEKIKRSRTGSATPLDVVLWTNAKYTEDNKTEIKDKSSELYGQLVKKLRSLGDDNLRIKSALQLIPDADFSMSKLRSNYMDAIALDSLDKGYGFNHPVMWVDADLTHLSKGSIEEVVDSLAHREAIFIHTNLQYSIDWQPNSAETGHDITTKAVILNEMQRRQLSWLDNEQYATGYHEESGLAFALGVYLNAGGVDRKQRINESATLLKRAEDVMYGDPEAPLIPSTIDTFEGFETKKTKYIKSARMGISARRHYQVAKREGAKGLYDVDASGYGGQLYTDMVKSEESVAIDNSSMEGLFNANNDQWGKRVPRKLAIDRERNKSYEVERNPDVERKRNRVQKIAYQLINRYFSE